MHYSIIGLASLIIFFTLMLGFIKLGYGVGKKRSSLSALSVTEGAVFTLMALIVAFTFASASQKLDQRRLTIVEEANAISTAYLRLDMLQMTDRQLLKNDFLSYVTSRLAIYEAMPDFKAVAAAQTDSNIKQQKLWTDAITACKNSSLPIAAMLILQPINNMFDLANLRSAYTFLHPPFIIFSLLILVAFLSAFLTGYGMAGKGAWNSIHVIVFAFIISVTIYIIIDLEYPRLGFIQESNYDYLLVDQINHMQSDIKAEKTLD